MAEKYTHAELTKRLKSPGWGLITGNKGKTVTGTLEKLVHVTHERHKKGQAPGLIEEIETAIGHDTN